MAALTTAPSHPTHTSASGAEHLTAPVTGHPARHQRAPGRSDNSYASTFCKYMLTAQNLRFLTPWILLQILETLMIQ